MAPGKNLALRIEEQHCSHADDGYKGASLLSQGVVKLHLLRWRSPKWLVAVATVDILSAPAHGTFQPIKVMTPVPGEDFSHLPNPLEVTLKLTVGRRDVVRLLRDSCERIANLHTRTRKQHIKCCDTCLQCKDGTRTSVSRRNPIRCGLCSIWGMVQVVGTPRTQLHTRSLSPLSLKPTFCGTWPVVTHLLLVDRHL